MLAQYVCLPVLALVSFSSISQADLLQVPGSFPTIQAALDASADGDQVLVAPGTYVENISFPPRAVHLVSESGPEVTVIDGDQQSAVVSFQAGCTLGSIVEGFTLTNGLNAYGGGVNCALGADATIRGNHIVHNHATYDGGGIFPRPENQVTVEGNLVGWNSAVSQAGGLQAPSSNSIVRNNIFVGNSAVYGGAYFSRVESSVVLTNCTFYANVGTNGSVASGDGGLQFESCVFDGHLGSRFSMYGGGTVNASYSTIPGGTGQSWFGTGCVDASPRLAAPQAGDFRLRPGSPALNVGDPGVAHQDLDGTRNDQGHTGGPAGILRESAWYPIASLPDARWSMGVAVSGSRLYSFAGETAVGRTSSVLSYDADSDAWTELADYPGPAIRSATAVALDGYIYFLCGYLYNYAASDRVWRFNPLDESWQEMSPMPAPRLHASVHAVSGKLYVFGGRSQPAWQYHSTAFVYDPSLEAAGGLPPWQELDAAVLPTPLGDNSGVNINGELLTFGSYEPAAWDRVMHYSPNTGLWRELPPSPLTSGCATVRLGGRAMILEGGSRKFWAWDPSKTIRDDGTYINGVQPAPEAADLDLFRSGQAEAGLNFRSLPELPGPGGGTGLAVMDGVIYAIGGVWPMSENCWVFGPAAGSL